MPLCIVVGVGPGLGASLVRRFHREGYKVAVLSRDVDRCNQLFADQKGSTIATFRADAAIWDDIVGGVRQAVAWAGEDVEVAIYNAAAMETDVASELPANYSDNLKVTLSGAIALATTTVPMMCNLGKGSILFSGGGLSIEPYPHMTVLGMGKAALRNYAGALHKEMKPANVLSAIVTICGLIEPGTDFDADTIADVYWQLHTASTDDWKSEIVFMPTGNRFYHAAASE